MNQQMRSPQPEPVRFESRPGLCLAGLRRFHRMSEVHRTIPVQWAEFRAHSTVTRPPEGNAYGVICGVAGGQLEYLCAVEVESFDHIPASTGRMRVPAQEYAVFIHEGPISGIGDTWSRILNWLRDGAFESNEAPDLEIYGPDYDPQGTNSRVEIWVGVKRRNSRTVQSARG